jgi:hypothetical protein
VWYYTFKEWISRIRKLSETTTRIYAQVDQFTVATPHSIFKIFMIFKKIFNFILFSHHITTQSVKWLAMEWISKLEKRYFILLSHHFHTLYIFCIFQKLKDTSSVYSLCSTFGFYCQRVLMKTNNLIALLTNIITITCFIYIIITCFEHNYMCLWLFVHYISKYYTT